jgi:hypothetical protein
MNELQTFGKFLILGWLILLLIGELITFHPKVSLLGKLPGDID